MKKFVFIITIFILIILEIYISYITLLPNDFVIITGENLKIKELPFIYKVETVQTSNINFKNSTLELKLGNTILK